MFSPTGRLLALPAAALAIGFAAGAAVLAQPMVSRPGPRRRKLRHAKAPGDGAYLVENAAAMRKMMHAMAVKPTGDVDRGFVAMMVPHHQGAIDMATAVLRHSRNPQIVGVAVDKDRLQPLEVPRSTLRIGRHRSLRTWHLSDAASTMPTAGSPATFGRAT